MARIQWEDLRTLTRREADQQTTQPTKSFVTDVELDDRLNLSCSALHDLLIEIQRHEWALTPATQAVHAVQDGVSTYALPLECLAVKEVRIYDGTFSQPVFPFGHTERAALDSSDGRDTWTWGYRYRVEGKSIAILPTPTAIVTELRITYIPEYTPRIAGQYIDLPYGWWRWAALHCAIGMVRKRYPDVMPQALMAEFNLEDRRIRALAGRRSPRALKVEPARDDVYDDVIAGMGRMWPS